MVLLPQMPMRGEHGQHCEFVEEEQEEEVPDYEDAKDARHQEHEQDEEVLGAGGHVPGNEDAGEHDDARQQHHGRGDAVDAQAEVDVEGLVQPSPGVDELVAAFAVVVHGEDYDGQREGEGACQDRKGLDGHRLAARHEHQQRTRSGGAAGWSAEGLCS